MFYPADQGQCVRAAEQFLRSTSAPTQGAPGRWIGAIVPHAGWICSGAIAGEAIATLAAGSEPDVVVVFGAVHTPLPLDRAALASHDAWMVPGGTSIVPVDLAHRLTRDEADRFAVDDRFHEREHAVEVELPLIQRAWPNALALPVEVPLMDDAVEMGIRTARSVQSVGLSAVYLASSDLTHYGPAYQNTPAGVGLAALDWAKDNDRRLLDVVTNMTPERIVTEVRQRANACGGGAIAAMMSACRQHGATSAKVLRHANSYEVLRDIVADNTPDNAVGYAAVVVG